MRAIRLAKLRRMKTSERVPSRSGTAWKSGAATMGELGLVVEQFLVGRPDEKLAGEQGVVGPLADHADRQAMRRVGPAEGVLDPDLAPPEVVEDPVEQGVEPGGVEGSVDLAPVDQAFDRGLADEELVLGRPPGVLARLEDERPGPGQDPLAPEDRLLDEPRRRQVPMPGAQTRRQVHRRLVHSGSSIKAPSPRTRPPRHPRGSAPLLDPVLVPSRATIRQGKVGSFRGSSIDHGRGERFENLASPPLRPSPGGSPPAIRRPTSGGRRRGGRRRRNWAGRRPPGRGRRSSPSAGPRRSSCRGGRGPSTSFSSSECMLILP